VNHIVKIKLKVSLCKEPKPKKVINGSKGDMNGLKEAMKGKKRIVKFILIVGRFKKTYQFHNSFLFLIEWLISFGLALKREWFFRRAYAIRTQRDKRPGGRMRYAPTFV
jgi:hypothetical protein